MIKKDLKTAGKLVNQLINEICERWMQDKHGKAYLVRHCESSEDCDNIDIQPVYSDTFYCLEDFIDVARICGCSFYVDCKENQAKIITPTLHIY